MVGKNWFQLVEKKNLFAKKRRTTAQCQKSGRGLQVDEKINKNFRLLP